MQFFDQMHRLVEVPVWPPSRIVSLVPSQTQLLYALNLESEVVGITKFCIHPDHWFHGKKRVGGTKTVNLTAVKALQPDLIIGNKEENSKENIEALSAVFPVWMSDIYTLDDALDMIGRLGNLTNRTESAETLIAKIRENFELHRPHPGWTPLRAAYLIWKNPYMAVGRNTFIHNMLEKAGFINVFENQERYPEITEAEIQQSSPDVILLSSEPYPFQPKHLEEFQNMCPSSKILIVDGEFFSWYGSRLADAPPYFAALRRGFTTY